MKPPGSIVNNAACQQLTTFRYFYILEFQEKKQTGLFGWKYPNPALGEVASSRQHFDEIPLSNNLVNYTLSYLDRTIIYKFIFLGIRTKQTGRDFKKVSWFNRQNWTPNACSFMAWVFLLYPADFEEGFVETALSFESKHK